MRNYEVVFIVHPDLEEAAFNEIVERVSGWVADGGGSVTKRDVWGKRDLAYMIRKKTEGQYVLFETEMDPAFCTTLERNMQLAEPIMRFLITQKN